MTRAENGAGMEAAAAAVSPWPNEGRRVANALRLAICEFW